jgi:hypothetical protein
MAYQKSAGVSDPFFVKKFIDDQEAGQVASTTGTTQAAAIAVTGTCCALTAAAAGGSVALPAAKQGMQLWIRNAHATNAMNVFGNNSTDTINGTVGTTAYSLAATKAACFFSPADGVWHVMLGA